MIELSTKLASAWLISSQFPLRGAGAGLYLQRHSFFLGQWFVELSDVVSDFSRIEFAHIVPRLTGFRSRDHQQRIKCTNQTI